jgi:hypothetical protein
VRKTAESEAEGEANNSGSLEAEMDGGRQTLEGRIQTSSPYGFSEDEFMPEKASSS